MNQKVGRVTPCAPSVGQCTNGAQGTDAPYPLPGSWSQGMRENERRLSMNLGWIEQNIVPIVT